MTADAVRQTLHNLRQRDLPPNGGRALAGVYESGRPDVEALGREVVATFSSTNGLDPDAYPSWLRMEQDLVTLAGDLLQAPRSVVGTVTSGGTESILLALLTARDARPELGRPTVVLPSTASGAFFQAARTLRVQPVVVEVDPDTGRADPVGMAAAITEATVLVVASAPSYALGVVDPVTEIAAAAQAHGVRCHVDAGLGGWLLPYLGREEPASTAFSFEVPGVTSISVDLDKYAYTPKTLSILLHRTAELRLPQFFSGGAGPGMPLVTSTAQGTRSGGPLAAAWAITRFIGDPGYVRLAGAVRRGVQLLADGLTAIDHVRLLAAPEVSVLAVGTDDRCDVFTICDELSSRGWYVQPQLSWGAFPPSVHLVLSAATVPRVPEFLDAFKASVRMATGAGPVRLRPEVLEAVRTVDLRRLDEPTLDELLELGGLQPGPGMTWPDRMAPVHAMLDAASPPVRQALLVGVLDRQTRPRHHG